MRQPLLKSRWKIYYLRGFGKRYPVCIESWCTNVVVINSRGVAERYSARPGIVKTIRTFEDR